MPRLRYTPPPGKGGPYSPPRPTRPVAKTPRKAPPKPKTMSRMSLSPRTELLMSPITHSDSPIEVMELKGKVIDRIFKHGETMCRGKINAAYIRGVARGGGGQVWEISDARGTIFGFAVTEETNEYVKLHLICATKFHGNGYKLFSNILQHCRFIQKKLKLNPVNLKIAQDYFDEARKFDMRVRHRGVIVHKIPQNFEPEEEIIVQTL